VVLRVLMPDQLVPQISILPRGDAGGFIEHIETEVGRVPDLDTMRRELSVLLGGRAGEDGDGSSLTSGASGDLRKATDLAFMIVGQWGLSEDFGLISVDAVRRQVSEDLKARQEAAVNKLLDEALANAKAIVAANAVVISALVEALLKRETLLEADLNEFWKTNKVVMPA
ncbi:MAG: hypothetical protein WCN95_11320, partial [bacterium]